MIKRSAKSIDCNISFEEDEWEDAASNLRVTSAVPLRTTLEDELARRGVRCEHDIDENGVRCLHVVKVETDDADATLRDLDLIGDYAYRFRLKRPPIIYMMDDFDHLFCWWFRDRRCFEGDVALCPKMRKASAYR